jgi:hypothetical protein
MNVFLLYALLLKATLTSFSGLASLPMVRNDLVVERKMLTDRQLNTAVAAGRTAPGPNGLYLVSVGYYAGGLPGAAAGLLAMMTLAARQKRHSRGGAGQRGPAAIGFSAACSRRDHRPVDLRHHAAEFCRFSVNEARYGVGRRRGRDHRIGRKNGPLRVPKDR